MVLRRLSLGFGLLALIWIAPGGCLNDTMGPTDFGYVPYPEYPPQSSPANCLKILKLAYVDRNLDEYIGLFANDYVFEFRQDDLTNPTNPIPGQQGLAAEKTEHDHMFHDVKVRKITLSFLHDNAVKDTVTFIGTWICHVTSVNLLIETSKDGAPVEHQVLNGRATFSFKEYPNEKASDGRPLWRIVRWQDQDFEEGLTPSGTARSPETVETWGEVKWLYR